MQDVMGACPQSRSVPSLSEVIIGRLVGIEHSGLPLIDYPGNPAGQPLAAMTTAHCGEDAVGRNVALLFADGDPAKPLIVGLIHNPFEETVEAIVDADPESQEPNIGFQLDGERLVLSAGREMVLKCGKASITLTRAGKILLRGAYLLSRSSGVNRIKGGSVQIN